MAAADLTREIEEVIESPVAEDMVTRDSAANTIEGTGRVQCVKVCGVVKRSREVSATNLQSGAWQKFNIQIFVVGNPVISFFLERSFALFMYGFRARGKIV